MAGDRWWAFSNENGWIVIDREWPDNEPASPDPWVIVRCSDWALFTEVRSSFPPPGYEYAPRYLSSLPEQKRKEAQAVLASLEEEYSERREDLQTALIRERHQEYNKSRNQEIRGIRQSYRERRVTHCWNCRRYLDSAIHWLCIRCGWIVCWHCGACGCGCPYRAKRSSPVS
jgi:hypothetical protein